MLCHAGMKCSGVGELKMKPNLLKALLALTTIGLALAFLLAVQRPAYAYVDPGSGLLIMQSIGSVVMGGLLVFRRKLSKLLRSKSSDVAVAAPEKAGLLQK
jgi:hypothetical protein